MYDLVITAFWQRVSTEVDSRELSQSKTDSIRAAGSCRGTTTPDTIAMQKKHNVQVALSTQVLFERWFQKTPRLNTSI